MGYWLLHASALGVPSQPCACQVSRPQYFVKLVNMAAPCRFALTLLAFIVDIAFTLSLGGLLGMHARMLWLNVTTIEMFEKQRVTQWPFDRGPRRNFQEVFGSRCVKAVTPRFKGLIALSSAWVRQRLEVLHMLFPSELVSPQQGPTVWIHNMQRGYPVSGRRPQVYGCCCG